MTSGKRLQPYYDRADRPLAENFKQVINHEYSLSDPNNPIKQKNLIDRKDLPTDKKQALQAITDGLTALGERRADKRPTGRYKCPRTCRF